MTKQILVGKGKEMHLMPRSVWEQGVRRATERGKNRLAFMSDDHHRVRRLAVVGLGHQGQPLAPEFFAGRLDLAVDRVVEILDELESRLFFLVRNDDGAVSWAFPVTVDRTPHRLSFSTGERLHGA